MARILIIDDDQAVCRLLAAMVERLGHAAVWACTAADGMQKVRTGAFDVVLLDVNLPDGNGIDMLPGIRRASSQPEVIIMTGYGGKQGAEMAIKNGAWDYLEKSEAPEATLLALKRVIQYREQVTGRQKDPVVLKLDGIVGADEGFRDCLNLLAKAAGGNMNVLITGDTGTGKELFARAIHQNSARARSNFVVVDCACLPETLVESILFGHVKGAFTGAGHDHNGLIAEAHQGTLFLDEIGEMPLSIQKSFLRVLEEHSYRPIGGQRERRSDFRLVAATNVDLEQLTAAGAFRKDLLYRIRALAVHLPRLAVRRADIRPLTVHHVHRFCERRRIEMKSCSTDFMEVLETHDWPGNVRELVNTLDVAVSTAVSEPVLFARHLPEHLRIRAVQSGLGQGQPSAGMGKTMTLKEIRKEAALKAEKQYLQELAARVGGDVREACRISGLSRSRYYELLKEHGLD